VTAANGRTGRSLVRALVLAGHRVRAFDIAVGVEQLRDQGAAENLVGDMLDPGTLSPRSRGCAIGGPHQAPMYPRQAEMGHGVVTAAVVDGERSAGSKDHLDP
jgi:nucleoside-diphosphate-sugar epimerase